MREFAISKMEPRGRLLLALALLAVAAGSYQPIWDPDTFWHLALGREILRRGAVVGEEIFSFTAAGTPWPDTEWLSHLLAYPLWRAGGFEALSAIAVIFAVAATLLSHRAARMGGASTLGFCLILGIFMNPLLGRMRFRPELASLVLFAALVCLIEREKAAPPPLLRQCAKIFALFLLWVQLHGGWSYGLMLLGLFLAGHLLDSLGDIQLFKARIKRCIALGTCASVPLLVNPFGIGMILFPFECLGIFADPGQVSIGEWARPQWTLDTAPFLAACIFLAVAAIFPLKRIRWSETIVIFGQVGLVFLWVRYCSFGWLALAPLAACRLEPLLGKLKLRATLSWIALLIVAFQGVQKAREARTTFNFVSNYPVDEVAFLKGRSIGGNVFHTYVTGGYLDLEYYPLGKIFSDGRQIPFLDEIRDLRLAGGSTEDFQSFLKRYPFDIAIYPHNPAKVPVAGQNCPQRAAASQLFSDKEWALVYFGRYGSVFLRRLPRFAEVVSREEYRHLMPWDWDFLAWSVESGSVPPESALVEIDRALSQRPILGMSPDLKALKTKIRAMGRE